MFEQYQECEIPYWATELPPATKNISLTQNEIDVLRRCLNYGFFAISNIEHDNNIGQQIQDTIDNIRQKLSS